MKKPKILVHVCCAPDALYVLGLLQADYEVTVYFYNPNIHPPEEFDLRLEEARKVARILNVDLIEEIYDDDRLKLKCLIGKAISLYIEGKDRETAMNIMEEISSLNLDENFLDAIIVFSELGDYFFVFGHSQIAANLYNQALEISIDYKLTLKSEILIEKLKRSYISTVLEGYSSEDMIDKLDLLLDKAYTIKDVEKYNEEIKKIKLISPHTTKFRSFSYLNSLLKIL